MAEIRLPSPSESWMTDTVPGHVHVFIASGASDRVSTHVWTEEDMIYFMYTRFPKVLVRYKDIVKQPDIMAMFILYSLGGVFVKSETFVIPTTLTPGKVTLQDGFIASPKRHPLLEKVLRDFLSTGPQSSMEWGEALSRLGGDMVVGQRVLKQ